MQRLFHGKARPNTTLPSALTLHACLQQPPPPCRGPSPRPRLAPLLGSAGRASTAPMLAITASLDTQTTSGHASGMQPPTPPLLPPRPPGSSPAPPAGRARRQGVVGRGALRGPAGAQRLVQPGLAQVHLPLQVGGWVLPPPSLLLRGHHLALASRASSWKWSRPCASNGTGCRRWLVPCALPLLVVVAVLVPAPVPVRNRGAGAGARHAMQCSAACVVCCRLCVCSAQPKGAAP